MSISLLLPLLTNNDRYGKFWTPVKKLLLLLNANVHSLSVLWCGRQKVSDHFCGEGAGGQWDAGGLGSS